METYEFVKNKYKIKPNKEYIFEIPNIGRNDLAELYAELGFTRGAEIGVERGLYSEVLLKANSKLHLHCIDPWLASAYEGNIHAVDKEQEPYNERFEEAKKRLSKYSATIIREPSLTALNRFSDGYFDFVYIDANHDFPNFINDLHQWKKKVRVGGIISGHDFAYFSYKKFNHVKRALIAYARCYRMIPLFIAGSNEYEEGIIRDKYRSWFWIKDK